MPNFAFVQYVTSSGTSSATPVTFGSNNTAGNIIVASVMGSSPITTDSQGASSFVTDSQGNQYYCVQAEDDVTVFYTAIYVAVKINAGPNTVTYNGSGGAILAAAEYSSASSNYFVCPGGAVDANTSGLIDNINTEFGGGSGTIFTSSSEVMVVWAIGVAEAPTTAATGTIRWQGSQGPPGFGLYGAIGDDNLASISSYSNFISAGPSLPYAGVRSSVFLNLIGGCTGVAPPPVPLGITCASPPAGDIGVPYTHTFPASGGTTPYTFSISVGSLPPGLTLNTSTGVVSGTPTGSGSSFTIKVTDFLSATATAPCSITINPNLSITCASPPTGSVGVSYTHTFPVTGGVSPYTFVIISGSLPPGLTLASSTGIVSGTPTASGTFPFTIQVTDNDSNVSSVPCSISISPLIINCGSPPVGFIGLFYDHTLPASGGTPPYSFSVISGSLPPGLFLDTSSGEISGTPSNIRIIGFKLFPFTFQVTDSNGSTVNVSCTIRIQNYLAGLPCN